MRIIGAAKMLFMQLINRGCEMKSDIQLTSGRTITHTLMPNGATDARPTTGYYSMTHAEYAEYITKAFPYLNLNRGV